MNEPKPVVGSSNTKLLAIEPYRSKDGVTAEVFFSKLGGTGAVVLQGHAPHDDDNAEVVLSLQEVHDLALWLQCTLGNNPPPPETFPRLSPELAERIYDMACATSRAWNGGDEIPYELKQALSQWIVDVGQRPALKANADPFKAICQGGSGGKCCDPDCEKCWPDPPAENGDVGS